MQLLTLAKFIKLPALILLAVLGVGGLSGCQSNDDPLKVVSGGKTDDPAPGYANVSPGSEQDFILNIGRRIYFSHGSAELTSVAHETLDLQAQWLVRYPNWLIKLQGFADDPGSNNTALSTKRAQVVMSYLASKGVNSQRLWAKGYGAERLVTPGCQSNMCRGVNRRVVVNLRTEFDEAAPQFKKTGQSG